MEYQASNMTIMVTDMDGAMRSSTEALGVLLGFQSVDEWAEVRSQAC
jgi:hypothetical protein